MKCDSCGRDFVDIENFVLQCRPCYFADRPRPITEDQIRERWEKWWTEKMMFDTDCEGWSLQEWAVAFAKHLLDEVLKGRG